MQSQERIGRIESSIRQRYALPLTKWMMGLLLIKILSTITPWFNRGPSVQIFNWNVSEVSAFWIHAFQFSQILSNYFITPCCRFPVFALFNSWYVTLTDGCPNPLNIFLRLVSVNNTYGVSLAYKLWMMKLFSKKSGGFRFPICRKLPCKLMSNLFSNTSLLQRNDGHSFFIISKST